MDEREKKIRQRLKDDFVHYADKCLKIRDKEGNISPFLFNKAQLHVHNIVEKQKRETGKVRVIVLKGRQQGISTYVGGRIFHQITHRRGVRAFILTHEADATDNLFEMSQRYYDNCPALIKPHAGTSSAKELTFDLLDSGYKVGTAGNKGVGRSGTNQYFHGSEVAQWPNALEHSAGVLQTVPSSPGTEIFLESTARGIGNYYHEQWQRAESGNSDYIAIFVPWFWQEEYRNPLKEDFTLADDEAELIDLYNLDAQQLLWRRSKVQELSSSGADGSKLFPQEYPMNAIEAFVTSQDNILIDSNVVMKARKTECEAYGPLIIGCDPARFGDDRTSIIFRKGRVAYNLKSYRKKDNMEVANLLHKMIIDHSPAKVFIDIGGGSGIVDRLNELGHSEIVKSINFGESALDEKRYPNKRSEMWCLMKLWLTATPCQIPNEDSLHADLTGPTYKYDNNSRPLLEKKEIMKARGVRSPDEGDALALTFAEPVESTTRNKQQSEAIASQLMSGSNRLQSLRFGR
jgi:hypothetical protein